jgi:hypothetical protein
MECVRYLEGAFFDVELFFYVFYYPSFKIVYSPVIRLRSHHQNRLLRRLTPLERMRLLAVACHTLLPLPHIHPTVSLLHVLLTASLVLRLVRTGLEMTCLADMLLFITTKI